MTLLEHIITHYMGQANGHGSERGVSYWDCPVCGSDSFHTLPTHPTYKHRAKCHSRDCGFRGDVDDMLKQFNPRATYDDRLWKLKQFMKAWEQAS